MEAFRLFCRRRDLVVVFLADLVLILLIGLLCYWFGLSGESSSLILWICFVAFFVPLFLLEDAISGRREDTCPNCCRNGSQFVGEKKVKREGLRGGCYTDVSGQCIVHADKADCEQPHQVVTTSTVATRHCSFCNKDFGARPQAEFSDPRPAGFPGGVHAAHSAPGLAPDPLLRLVLEQGSRHAAQAGRSRRHRVGRIGRTGAGLQPGQPDVGHAHQAGVRDRPAGVSSTGTTTTTTTGSTVTRGQT